MVARETDHAGSVLDGDRSELGRWASTRLTYLDNLKVVLIAAIIALHAVLGYAGIVEGGPTRSCVR
jgi:hypothetical protein